MIPRGAYIENWANTDATDDISQCHRFLTNLIKAGKDYQCSVTLFVTVSLFCYWVPVIFVCLRDLWFILISANFAGKTLVICYYNYLATY